MRTAPTDAMLDAAIARAKAEKPLTFAEFFGAERVLRRDVGLLPTRMAPHPADERVDVPPAALVCSARLP